MYNKDLSFTIIIILEDFTYQLSFSLIERLLLHILLFCTYYILY